MEMMNSIFNYFDKFLPLSEEARKLVLSSVEIENVPKGTILVNQGKVNNHFYVIKNGVARGYYIQDGIEVTSTLWKENEVFGDVITYISFEPATKSYQVLEDSVLFKINIARFRALFEINIEISNMARIMVEKYILKQENEKKRFRDLTAYERFQIFIAERSDLIHRVKSIHIASFLNMTPETFSRVHAEWTRKNS